MTGGCFRGKLPSAAAPIRAPLSMQSIAAEVLWVWMLCVGARWSHDNARSKWLACLHAMFEQLQSCNNPKSLITVCIGRRCDSAGLYAQS